MTVKPYRLNLKKLSGGQMRLLDAVYSLLPDAGSRDSITDSLKKSLANELGEQVSVRLESASLKPFSEFAAALPQHALVAVLGLGAREARIVLEVDFTIAALAVERILGGAASSLPEPRRLSDTEMGVVQYLLAQMLLELHRSSGGAERARLRIERLALGREELRGAVEESAECAALSFRVTIARHAGFARIIFPEPFAEQALLETVSPGESRQEEAAQMIERMGRYSYVRTTIWAEAGRTTLTPSEISQLEPGDILLMDRGDMTLSGGGCGRAVLRAGHGLASGLEAQVELTDKRARAGITGIHRGD